MSEAGSTNVVHVVHESEAQRQFARVRIPATLVIDNHGYNIVDISAGGASIENPNKKLHSNRLYSGKLMIAVDDFEFSYDIEFSTLKQEGQNIGCVFQNVEKPFRNALRYIITAFLGGELVTTGDMLNTISRDNHTSARKKKQLKAITPAERLASIAGSLTFLFVGLLAFTYVMVSLIGVYGVRESSSAKITSFTQDVIMPFDGQVELLMDESATEVSRGQILATYQSANVSIDTTSLPQKTKDILINLDTEMVSSSGSINSPCDCLIADKSVQNGQFAQKGQPVLTLLPKQAETFISADFTFAEGEDLKVGQQVWFKVFGSDEYHSGAVSDLKVSATGLSVEAIVKPDQALALGEYAKPVKVVSTPSLLPNMFISWL